MRKISRFSSALSLCAFVALSLCAFVALSLLFTFPLFAADKPQPAKPEAAVVPAGKIIPGTWVDFAQGQYTVARDNDTVMIISTWDELVGPDQVIDWRRTPKKEIPPIIEKLMKKLVDLPGIINVIVAKHRVEIYRANVYGWDNVMKDILAAFSGSELKKK